MRVILPVARISGFDIVDDGMVYLESTEVKYIRPDRYHTKYNEVILKNNERYITKLNIQELIVILG